MTTDELIIELERLGYNDVSVAVGPLAYMRYKGMGLVLFDYHNGFWKFRHMCNRFEYIDSVNYAWHDIEEGLSLEAMILLYRNML